MSENIFKKKTIKSSWFFTVELESWLCLSFDLQCVQLFDLDYSCTNFLWVFSKKRVGCFAQSTVDPYLEAIKAQNSITHGRVFAPITTCPRLFC